MIESFTMVKGGSPYWGLGKSKKERRRRCKLGTDTGLKWKDRIEVRQVKKDRVQSMESSPVSIGNRTNK